MKNFLLCLVVLILYSCKQKEAEVAIEETASTTIGASDFTMVFASCNDPHRPMPLWKPILDNHPDLFVWGGDNIYADTDDMAKMKADYDLVLANADYKELQKSTDILGTWDDHDFGENDAGKEWKKKEEAKWLLLDFLGDYDKSIDSRAGVYGSHDLSVGNSDERIKLILLDTRTFRDTLKPSTKEGWRFEPWPTADTSRTMLGEEQWTWLEQELEDDSATFTVIVSSVQFLNDEHGWEKWGNFPSQVEKMNEILINAKAKNILLLSGDRHLAEISVKELEGLDYPLVDFTSSGLTHTWMNGATESNKFRKSNVIKRLNFGVLRFDFENESITFEIRGENNFLYEQFEQKY